MDAQVALSGSDEAFFGRNVLTGLISGIEAATREKTSSRRWGPAVLACAMWMDDPELLAVLQKMTNVCVVVTKQRKGKYRQRRFHALRELAQENGLSQEAYPELNELARPQDGMPLIVGPGSPPWWEEGGISGVREVGFRRAGDHLVPIVHAKIALLGHMGWTDEHPSGDMVDEIYFVPDRLWIGSANFTASSRASLEMGMWTSDPELMTAARRFLLTLVSLSEPLGKGPDHLDPELVPIEYDDDAMWEYVRNNAERFAEDADED